MSKFIISIGVIDKKLFLPIIYAISYIFINIYKNNTLNDMITSLLESSGIFIGQILTFFVGRLIRYRSKTPQKNKRSPLHYILDYFIVFIICTLYIIDGQSEEYIKEKNDEMSEEEKNDYSREIYFIYGIEIIIISIISYFWLKIRYYIHHMISIIFIVLLCVIIDLLLGNFLHIYTYSIYSAIINILADTSIFTYTKYLVERKYYYNMDILFIYGIFNAIIYFISLIYTIVIQSKNGTNVVIFQFYEFYKEYGAGAMVSRFFIGIFIRGFYLNMLEFLIVERLAPTYIIIGYEIGLLPSALAIAKEEHTKLWPLIIMFILQSIGLLFYLEMFEFNFCSLNKNTRKQIYERGQLQLQLQERKLSNSTITFKGYDISENIKLQELEMTGLEREVSEA